MKSCHCQRLPGSCNTFTACCPTTAAAAAPARIHPNIHIDPHSSHALHILYSLMSSIKLMGHNCTSKSPTKRVPILFVEQICCVAHGNSPVADDDQQWRDGNHWTPPRVLSWSSLPGVHPTGRICNLLPLLYAKRNANNVWSRKLPFATVNLL